MCVCVRVCLCACVCYIRSDYQRQCFICPEILNESANVVFLCSLLRTAFTDTHPAVFLKLAPTVATLRISQGAQLRVGCLLTNILQYNHIFFLPRLFSSYGGGKWRLKVKTEPVSCTRQTSPSQHQTLK